MKQLKSLVWDILINTVMIYIEADVKGKIKVARITRSCGVPALDQRVLRGVQGASFKPYMENGVAYPFKAEQPFELPLE